MRELYLFSFREGSLEVVVWGGGGGGEVCVEEALTDKTEKTLFELGPHKGKRVLKGDGVGLTDGGDTNKVACIMVAALIVGGGGRDRSRV